MRIENWSVVLSDAFNYEYQVPELITSCIMGKVYDHPHYDDGHQIQTSMIKKVEHGVVITCSGSRFELGEINPKYLETYPSALDLLNK